MRSAGREAWHVRGRLAHQIAWSSRLSGRGFVEVRIPKLRDRAQSVPMTGRRVDSDRFGWNVFYQDTADDGGGLLCSEWGFA